MREERVLRDAALLLLPQHDLHRIVEQRLGEIIGRLAQEDARARMLAHQQRQRAGVIVVRVADQDRADRVEAELFQQRQRLDALAARMHARIEHEAAVRLEIEQVGVRADFVAAG